MFVYVAAYGGALAAENALTGNERRYDLSTLPKVTFTDPAVSSVGLTEDEARAQAIEPLVSKLPLEHVPRALAARDTRGFIKLVADGATQRIVGAHILAAEAGEMITEPALAIKLGLTIEDLTSTFHPYLTLSEGIKLAAQAFTKDVAKLSCCVAQRIRAAAKSARRRGLSVARRGLRSSAGDSTAAAPVGEPLPRRRGRLRGRLGSDPRALRTRVPGLSPAPRSVRRPDLGRRESMLHRRDRPDRLHDRGRGRPRPDPPPRPAERCAQLARLPAPRGARAGRRPVTGLHRERGARLARGPRRPTRPGSEGRAATLARARQRADPR